MKTIRAEIGAGAATPLQDWSELNRQWLVDELGRLCARIEGQAAGVARDGNGTGTGTGFTPALVRCARLFGLSVFERELLLLVAGLELDGRLRAAVAARDAAGGGRASFGVALALLDEPHWDALSPEAPLRRWNMVAPEPFAALTAAPLAIDERILHFIAGIPAADPRLAGRARLLPAAELCEAADEALTRRIARALSGDGTAAPDSAPIVALVGAAEDPEPRRDLALAVAAGLGAGALWVAAADLPSDAAGLDTVARHLDREAALAGAIVLLSAEPGEGEAAAASLAGRLGRPFLWLGAAPPAPVALPPRRGVLRFEAPEAEARRGGRATQCRWRAVATAAGTADPDVLAALDRASGQFRLTRTGLTGMADRLGATPREMRADAVWPAAREAARGGLDALAQRVESRVGFDDLVLPSGQMAVLHALARQLRNRDRVFQDWGFGAKHRLGQALVALFAGESGTGKTLAAEAIANAVELDLYRVDLATLVSKYIGETEKNLKRLFEAAEASGAVLLFDEADALFGKRSEVRDSHDRYANIEVAYLLQRVETYRGLAILTTNMRSALDRAFLRRIRFVVSFPFPDAAARAAIWRRQFPAEAPVGEIDCAALARLNLAGGNIRAVALAAAFKAADRGVPIDQALLLEAAREELAKLDRPAGPLGGAVSA